MQSITETLRSEVQSHVFPGTVVVVRRGDQTRAVAVGRAEVSPSTPMRVDDRFRVASVTKCMMAAVTLQLAGQGRLSLGDTVQKWLPRLLPRGRDITVADLLGQTSGLPEVGAAPGYQHLVDTGAAQPAALVGLVAHRPLQFAPGTRSYYSNTNYIVLGMLLEKVTHEPLGTLLEQRLFRPLGMHSAHLAPVASMTPPLAHGYDHRKDVTTPEIRYTYGAGGVVADAADVARFDEQLMAGHVVPRPLLQKMMVQRRETNPDLPYVGYGLGLGTVPTPCGTAYGHTGSFPGFTTDVFSTRNGDRSYVLMMNSTINVAVNDAVVAVLDAAICSP